MQKKISMAEIPENRSNFSKSFTPFRIILPCLNDATNSWKNHEDAALYYCKESCWTVYFQANPHARYCYLKKNVKYKVKHTQHEIQIFTEENTRKINHTQFKRKGVRAEGIKELRRKTLLKIVYILYWDRVTNKTRFAPVNVFI